VVNVIPVLATRIADLHNLNADPTPSFDFSANSDPRLHFEPLRIHSERPRSSIAPF
jgi:hypothetical protein